MKDKTRHAGIGVGLFGGAALFGTLTLATLVAAAILGLATTVDAWLAALIVDGAPLVVTAIAALVARRQVGAAVPPVPEQAIADADADVHAVREAAHR